MKKYIFGIFGGGFFFLALVLFFFLSFKTISFIVLSLAIALSILFSILSLVKKEKPIAISIILLVLGVLFLLFLLFSLLSYAAYTHSPDYAAMYNSQLSAIVPYSADFYSDGNIIEVSLNNQGDPIQLTLEGNSSGVGCSNPQLVAVNSQGEFLTPSDYIATNESFAVAYDCENEVSAGDSFYGMLRLGYIRNGVEDTYSFPIGGDYV